MSVRHVRLVLFLLIAGGVFPAAARAAHWYVDSKATATATGKSWSAAWRSPSAIAWNSVAAGDTIWIRGGPYNDRITIGKSGTSAKARITLKGVNKPVIRGIDGGSHDYVGVIGFEFTHASGVTYESIRMSGCDGWLIQDNHFHHTYGTAVNARYGTVNSNNVVRANLFDDIGSASGGAGAGTVIVFFGDQNLVEYNTVMKSLDRVRAFGRANVVRNNHFGATDSKLYPKSSPYPFHTDTFQSFNAPRLLSQLLYERNWDEDNRDSVGGTNAHGFLIQDEERKGINWIIARFNVLLRVGGVAYQFKNVDRVYGYNLTSVAVQSGAPRPYRNAFAQDPNSTSTGYDWRNNTWTYSPNTMDGIFSASTLPRNFTHGHQHSFQAGQLPSASTNLGQVDPLFVNRGADNYALQSGSPLRNRGGAITTATSAGSSSKQLTVADSRRLFDGWGIAEGDEIKIGTGGSYVRISSINYGTNVVTLAAARTWKSGDPVFVKGSEDIGALPFAFAKDFQVTNTTPASLPAGNVTLSATVSVPDAVRKVEFLVDGVPVGEDFSAPYEVTWQSDGGSHSVEARAYNAWPSRTLFKGSAVSTGGGSSPAPNTAPTISNIPDRTVAPGATTGAVGFTVGDTQTAAGSLTLSAASSNTTLLPVANIVFGGSGANRTVTVTPASGRTGSATVTITVSDGSLSASDSFVLTVAQAGSAPAITTQPAAQTVNVGGEASFTVAASGSPTPTYRWQVSTNSGGSWSDLSDAAPYSGTRSATLRVAGATQTLNGYRYRAVVTNASGSVTSSAAILTVNAAADLPRITAQPQSATVPAGGSIRFAVTAQGTGTLRYQWKKDGADLVGRTYSSFTLNNVQAGNAGEYHVVVSNAAGSVSSAKARLTVGSGTVATAPAISQQPAPRTAAVGDDVTFTVAATGSGTLAYQWQKNGSTIAGATGATFRLDDVDAADAGDYRVVVSNSAGSVTSAAAELRVTPGAIPITGLAIVSTQALVEEGSATMVGGFVVGDNEAKTYLIRGVGPTLAEFGISGVLVDPIIRVYSGEDEIASNDNWGSVTNLAQLTAATQTVGAFKLPTGSRDAALLLTLQPGQYSVRISGVGSGDAATGVALFEVYELP